MPFLTLALEQGSMFLPCRMGVSQPRLGILKAAGGPIPAPISFRGLVDTGAGITCIDSKLMDILGIPPKGVIPIHTPSTSGTPHLTTSFDVTLGIIFPMQSYVFHALPVATCDFSALGIDALIGMDVLKNLHLILNGPTGFFTAGV